MNKKIGSCILFIIAILLITVGAINMYKYYDEVVLLKEKQNNLIDSFYSDFESLEPIDILIDINQEVDDTEIYEDEKTEAEDIELPPQTIGVMTIDSLGVTAPIAQGLTDEILKTYIGMYNTTDPLGELGGNTGFAAHSTTRNSCTYCWFDKIGDLQLESEISILWHDKKQYTYKVVEIYQWDSPDSDYAYKKDPDNSRITLVTCSEGDADYRHYIIAELVDVAEL